MTPYVWTAPALAMRPHVPPVPDAPGGRMPLTLRVAFRRFSQREYGPRGCPVFI